MEGFIFGIPGVEGALTVVWKTAASGAQFSEVSFSTPPGPGTLALLGIAAAACRRRR
jgi:MYXO-CTERM domain-containing protein